MEVIEDGRNSVGETYAYNYFTTQATDTTNCPACDKCGSHKTRQLVDMWYACSACGKNFSLGPGSGSLGGALRPMTEADGEKAVDEVERDVRDMLREDRAKGEKGRSSGSGGVGKKKRVKGGRGRVEQEPFSFTRAERTVVKTERLNGGMRTARLRVCMSKVEHELVMRYATRFACSFTSMVETVLGEWICGKGSQVEVVVFPGLDVTGWPPAWIRERVRVEMLTVPAQLGLLKRLARGQGQSLSGYVRGVLRDWIEKQRRIDMECGEEV